MELIGNLISNSLSNFHQTLIEYERKALEDSVKEGNAIDYIYFLTYCRCKHCENNRIIRHKNGYNYLCWCVENKDSKRLESNKKTIKAIFNEKQKYAYNIDYISTIENKNKWSYYWNMIELYKNNTKKNILQTYKDNDFDKGILDICFKCKYWNNKERFDFDNTTIERLIMSRCDCGIDLYNINDILECEHYLKLKNEIDEIPF